MSINHDIMCVTVLQPTAYWGLEKKSTASSTAFSQKKEDANAFLNAPCKWFSPAP
jgi:hypothetical protein